MMLQKSGAIGQMERYKPGQRDLNRATAWLDELQAISPALLGSPAFAEWYSANRGQLAACVEWVEEALPPGINAANMYNHEAGVLVMYIPKLPCEDGFLLAHELSHGLLAEQGYPGVSQPKGAPRSMIADALGSLLTDPLINMRLAAYGFDIAARSIYEQEQMFANLMSKDEPTQRDLRQLWAINYLSTVYEYRAATGATEPTPIQADFLARFPRVAKEARRIGKVIECYDVTTPEGQRAALKSVINLYKEWRGRYFVVWTDAPVVTTNGTTWNEVTVSSHYNTTAAGLHGTGAMKVCGAISEHTGYIYAGAYTATGAGQAATSTLYRSIDDGASWAAQGDMTNARWTGYDMHFPYHNNTLATAGMDDRYFYWTKCDSATTVMPMRTDRLLGTQTQLDLTPASVDTRGMGCVHTCAIDSRVIAVVTFVVSGSAYAAGVLVSRNGGSTWTPIVPETVAIGGRWINVEIAGDNPNVLYLTGEDGKVGYSTNLGAVILNKDIGGSVNILRLVGN